MPELGIILVIYNQSQNLEPLYKSIQAQSYHDFRIYFVDNNSADNSVSHSKELNSSLNLDIRYIILNENTGFAKGNNIGSKKALADGCKYLFILNNDMVLENTCLAELVKLIESDESVACTGPLILSHKLKKPDIIQEYGGKVNFKLAEVEKYFTNENINSVSLPEIQETDFISGGACLIRTEIFVKAGMFEEKYFAYLDEIDLIKRIREFGKYMLLVTSKSVVWHNHNWSKTNRQNYYFEYFLMERNKFLYYHKYRFYSSMIFMLAADIIKFPRRLLWFMKVCDFKLGMYYLKGMVYGILNRSGKPNFYFVK